jgi:dTDP-4-dehydrorhamnose reductase
MAALGIRMIHPSTDCEFKGYPSKDHLYEKTDKTDAEDAYGASKRIATSILLERYPKTVRVLRTSIVGIEPANGNRSLLSWFLSQNVSVCGYINHYWNGITTLEWAKQSLQILSFFENTPPLTQVGTDPVTKHELLCSFGKIFGKDIKIIPMQAEDKIVNKCLKSDVQLDHLEDQLRELKNFYNL